MNLKVKKLHPDAKLLAPAKIGDAGMDIGFVEYSQKGKKSGSIDEHGNIVYYTGIAIEMPEIDLPGFKLTCIGLMKSSGCEKSLILANCVGVIDFGYRGEICFKFKPLLTFSNEYINFNKKNAKFNVNEMIGQLLFIPVKTHMDIVFVDELSETERGNKGYGEATKERQTN